MKLSLARGHLISPRKFISSRVMIRQEEIDYKSGSLRIIRFGV